MLFCPICAAVNVRTTDGTVSKNELKIKKKKTKTKKKVFFNISFKILTLK